MCKGSWSLAPYVLTHDTRCKNLASDLVSFTQRNETPVLQKFSESECIGLQDKLYWGAISLLLC